MTEKLRTSEFIKFALKILATRDHFKEETAQKLKLKGATNEEIEEVIKYLNKFNYLNDNALLREYAAEVAFKGKGINYLKQKLWEKGCQELLTLCNLDSFYTPEQEIAAAIKAASKIKSRDFEKMEQKLTSRGFSYSAVSAAVKHEKEKTSL